MTSTSTANEGISVSDRLRELELGFATLSAVLTTKIDTLMSVTGSKDVDFEARIRVLEAKMQRATGMALTGGGVLGTVGGAVISWLLTR